MRKTTKTRNYRSRRAIAKLNAVIFAIVGFCLSVPFVLDMIFGGASVIMPLHTILFILMFIPGAPLFFFGMLGIVLNRANTNSGSSIEGDLGRIRHAVEQDRMERK